MDSSINEIGALIAGACAACLGIGILVDFFLTIAGRD